MVNQRFVCYTGKSEGHVLAWGGILRAGTAQNGRDAVRVVRWPFCGSRDVPGRNSAGGNCAERAGCGACDAPVNLWQEWCAGQSAFCVLHWSVRR